MLHLKQRQRHHKSLAPHLTHHRQDPLQQPQQQLHMCQHQNPEHHLKKHPKLYHHHYHHHQQQQQHGLPQKLLE